MFSHCQPIFINNLYGLLTINTTESSSCSQSRQWYFFYDYGYTLLIRLINTAHLISNAFILKIYSTKNKQKTLIFDSSNTTLTENDLQFDVKTEKTGIWLELISMKKEKLPETSSFMIDYAFRANVQSRYGRQILQQNNSFDASQPAFIALITIIAVLVVAILIAIGILVYRYCSRRKHSKTRRVPLDQAHLAESNTPSSSSSSYSIHSTKQSYFHRSKEPIQHTLSSLGQSINTAPSMIPSRRLQQSMMDAYLNDFHTLQPTTVDPKKLHPYLFIDLHSTSSETVPDSSTKKYSNENSTTSGYDTSTGGEERNRSNSLRYRRRRRSYHQQRQRRRSTLAFKRIHAARFIMRERSLPHTAIKLPQLRQRSNLPFHISANQSSSNTSNPNQDSISTNFSLTTDNYDENHAYHVSENRLMDTIEEERTATVQQPGFFEMVSVHRGDESDMAQYEDSPFQGQTSRYQGNGIAYINESIIV